jgi:hypothetical protein
MNNEELAVWLQTPETQQGFRIAGVVVAPFTGFLWGMLVGALVAPKGQRWEGAITGGWWSAAINTGRALVCVPDALQGPCTVLGLPLPTAGAIYGAWQYR